MHGIKHKKKRSNDAPREDTVPTAPTSSEQQQMVQKMVTEECNPS